MTWDESSSGWRRVARRIGLGRAIYRFYHAPRGFMRHVQAEGIAQYAATRRGKRAMERAVGALSPISDHITNRLPGRVTFVTGAGFWYQTVFCAYSLFVASGGVLRILLVDDGTLNARHVEAFKILFPDVEVDWQCDIAKRLDRVLPESRFPALRKRRIEYPHLRKMTDVHTRRDGWYVVLDSDMLFWREPVELLNWLRNPEAPLHMIDVETSYGYSFKLLNELAGTEVPERLNVGAIGFDSETLDWEELEYWTAETIRREGTSYYQEQALCAMLLARGQGVALPAETYICYPDRLEVENPKAILHHYVADSKREYFQQAWREVRRRFPS